ncbi:hypothetical protein EMPG_15154 [Blastomyces silverae]|uniref:Uncharacterized protein n=1 Tax=Blastomyces silverae TaxID=2060906 RepID=A0A0H1BDA0_9EURO|nr:hypothetical protein EMPG_15154 [Blastomyces silverae]
MPRTRRLLREEITYSVAKEREVNVLHQLGYHDQQTRFFSYLNDKRAWMKGVIVHHLGLRSIEVNVFSFDFLFHTVLEKTSNLEMGMKRYARSADIPLPSHHLEKLGFWLNGGNRMKALEGQKMIIVGDHDIKLRTNLFRDLSRILLSLSQIPLQQIGSFIIDCNGFLRLGNRPLSIEIQQLENEKIPINIPRDYTYSTVESYVMDMLAIHDSRLQNQPNTIRMELMAALKTEETKRSSSIILADVGKSMPGLPATMEQVWTSGTFWYTLALSSPTGLFSIFYNHILPLLSDHLSEEIGEVMPFFWVKDVGKFVANKISDKKRYDHDLRMAFEGSNPN